MSKEPEYCFYCDACVSGKGKGDHFPIPKNCGGKLTVPCCQSCHDMKDRFPIGSWPTEWISVVISDLPKMSRETRLFLAMMVRTAAEKVQINHGRGMQ